MLRTTSGSGLNVQRAPYWVAFRHVQPEELRLLAPGMPVISPTYGDSRVSLNTVEEIRKLRSAIVAAYDRESVRKDEGRADEGAVGSPKWRRAPCTDALRCRTFLRARCELHARGMSPRLAGAVDT